jgi:hypothetical protein
MTKRKPNPHIGGSFDDFLAEEGILEECEYQALREIIADQVRKAMEIQKLSKTAMAARMATSRRQLARLLDPKAPSNVTLATMAKAARAVGRELKIELV